MNNTLNKNETSLLLVIDVQKNFINKNTLDIPNKIDNLINKDIFNYMVFTKYINNENSNFYKVLKYKGCINEEDQKIVIDTRNNKVLEKTTYTAVNDELIDYIKNNNINTIYLCGIDTDACVLTTAINLFENNYNVKVIKNCCMSHSGKKYHNYAIKILKKLIGKNSIIQDK